MTIKLNNNFEPGFKLVIEQNDCLDNIEDYMNMKYTK